MQRAACEAGISPIEFWQLTYRDIDNSLRGYAERRKDEWRRTRFGAYITYCANAKDPVSMEEFLPIDKEKKDPKKRLMTKREYIKMQQNWN